VDEPGGARRRRVAKGLVKPLGTWLRVGAAFTNHCRSSVSCSGKEEGCRGRQTWWVLVAGDPLAPGIGWGRRSLVSHGAKWE
jgi:hypothetical protein